MSIVLKDEKRHRNIHIGIRGDNDWSFDQIQPGEIVMASDLSDCVVGRARLTDCTFVGCLVGGLDFTGCILTRVSFVGCFADDATPLALGEGADVSFSRCYIAVDKSKWDRAINSWSPSELELFRKMLSPHNNVRYNIVMKMKEGLSSDLIPLLACALLDDQWDVTGAALEALGALYRNAPEYTDTLAKYMFTFLYDEDNIVTEDARRLVLELHPSAELLLPAIERIAADDPNESIAGLISAQNLVRTKRDYLPLVLQQELRRAVEAEDPDVRVVAMWTMGILRAPEIVGFVMRGLEDSDMDVVHAALEAVEYLEVEYPQERVRSLLTHPDDTLRYSALQALYFSFRSTDEDAHRMMNDSSADVRRLASKMLADKPLADS
jgi:HEAT repeat protein